MRKIRTTHRTHFLCNRVRLKCKVQYEQKSINDVIYNTVLSEVIKDFTHIKKVKNGDYVGICPFCSTKQDSTRHFRVSDSKRRFKCFNCGAAGSNSVGFLLRFLNKPFDFVLRFVNYKYHNNKYKLIEKTVASEQSCIDETDLSLPF